MVKWEGQVWGLSIRWKWWGFGEGQADEEYPYEEMMYCCWAVHEPPLRWKGRRFGDGEALVDWEGVNLLSLVDMAGGETPPLQELG